MPVDSPFHDIFIKDVPVHELILQDISRHGDLNALIDSESARIYTFNEVKEKSARLAVGLHENNLRHKDVVTVCLPNAPEFGIIILGVLSRGGVISGVNSLYTAEELYRHLKDSSSKFVFTKKEFVDKILTASNKLGSQIQKIFLLDAKKGEILGDERLCSFDFLLEYSSDTKIPEVKIWTKTDMAFLPFSSGTTGLSKGVMLSHYNVTSMLQIISTKAYFLNPSTGDHVLGILPFFHIFGLTVLMNCLREGVATVTMAKFELPNFLHLIQKYKVPVLFVAPPILLSLAKDEIVNKYDISSVISVSVGAAPVGKELSLEVVARHPNIKYLLQGYGMTETGCASHIMPATLVTNVKHGSCGMLLPNFQCKIVDVESGNEVGVNQKGEICVKSVSCTMGYYNNPKATSELYDKDGWLHSGDIGYYDEDGYFFVIDRLKELIKVKGFQVPPAELEDLLMSHGEIKDAAVIGIPDSASGEVPRAYIVLEPNSGLSEAQVAEFIDSQVAGYKRLRGGVEFLDEIPKSPSGKILRRQLREYFTSTKKTPVAKL